ncbi:hypothetical protein BT93_I0554 [Corymbia citriodora subsp. variegata]|nr:hypothetical protein BT93_I0554 [Corymbia citriodora subsp. variegata]
MIYSFTEERRRGTPLFTWRSTPARALGGRTAEASFQSTDAGIHNVLVISTSPRRSLSMTRICFIDKIYQNRLASSVDAGGFKE